MGYLSIFCILSTDVRSSSTTTAHLKCLLSRGDPYTIMCFTCLIQQILFCSYVAEGLFIIYGSTTMQKTLDHIKYVLVLLPKRRQNHYIRIWYKHFENVVMLKCL